MPEVLSHEGHCGCHADKSPPVQPKVEAGGAADSGRREPSVLRERTARAGRGGWRGGGWRKQRQVAAAAAAKENQQVSLPDIVHQLTITKCDVHKYKAQSAQYKVL